VSGTDIIRGGNVGANQQREAVLVRDNVVNTCRQWRAVEASDRQTMDVSVASSNN